MSKIHIFDASAILAYLQEEKGTEVVEAALDEGAGWISTVNTCEVLGKLLEKGMPLDEAQPALDGLGLAVVDFDQELASLAASLRIQTKSIGASLGDRACLALAMYALKSSDAPVVYTSEQGWGRVKLPFKIVVIRPAKTSG